MLSVLPKIFKEVTNMKKGLLSVLLSFVMLISFVPVAFADEGVENFTQINTYTEGQFIDVPTGQWYAATVQRAYELGLMRGSSDTTFNPTGSITIAETLTLACRLHSTYYSNGAQLVQGTPWYQVYVDYAVDKGIIAADEYDSYTNQATRAQFVTILAAAMPAGALPAVNTVDDGMIPDIAADAAYYEEAYLLYRAGILKGSDDKGTFNPDSNIMRSEVATIVVRMADPAKRVAITLKNPALHPSEKVVLNAEEIYAKCASAVFYIEIYDRSGAAISSGSGVFISADGKALTNYHVIKNAYSAKIMTNDGQVYDVTGYYDAQETIDMALIQIAGSKFPYLSVGDSTKIAPGQTIFAIGSPRGLDDTISQGIISNANRVIDGLGYIQMTAPISPGSSGGALINDQGLLIGLNTATYKDAQNINLAVPIHRYQELSVGAIKSFPVGNNIPEYSGATLNFDSSLSVSVGRSGVVSITANPGNCAEDVTIRWDCADTNIAEPQWGEWNGWDIDLYIYGKAEGSTTITLSLLTDDDVVLARKTLYVTVGKASSQENAFNTLKSWIIANANYTFSDGDIGYNETYYDDEGVDSYTLYIDTSTGMINVMMLEKYNNSTFTSFLTIKPSGQDVFAVFFCKNSYANIDFSGTAYIYAPSFNENYPFQFENHSGYDGDISILQDIAKYEFLDSLNFLDHVLNTYIPQYNLSIVDFGFSNHNSDNGGSGSQPTASAFPMSIVLNVGETQSVYIDVSEFVNVDTTFTQKSGDTSIATSVWGPEETTDLIWSVQVTGVSVGQTYVAISNTLTSQVITVSVTVVGTSASDFLSGLVAKNFTWHLYSNDGKTYLGKLTTNKYDSNGIWNESGKYGSKYQSVSIWNEYGTYGSNYSNESAFNEYATKPPIIVDCYGNFVGYLTANKYISQGYSITQIHQFLLAHNQ